MAFRALHKPCFLSLIPCTLSSSHWNCLPLFERITYPSCFALTLSQVISYPVLSHPFFVKILCLSLMTQRKCQLLYKPWLSFLDRADLSPPPLGPIGTLFTTSGEYCAHCWDTRADGTWAVPRTFRTLSLWDSSKQRVTMTAIVTVMGTQTWPGLCYTFITQNYKIIEHTHLLCQVVSCWSEKMLGSPPLGQCITYSRYFMRVSLIAVKDNNSTCNLGSDL